MQATEAVANHGLVATRWARIRAQFRVEFLLTIRRGESVLLTFAIPVGLFAFFSLVDVLPVDGDTNQFLFPGIVALAVMSTGMVSLAIATGFERSTKVLKRLGVSPLRRSDLLIAKMLSITVIEVLQIVVLTAEAYALGWRSSGVNVGVAIAVVLLGTIVFAGIGLLLAGTLPALTTLAAANGLYLVLLMSGGMVISLDKFPDPMRNVAQVLPAGALSDAMRAALTGVGVPGRAWVVLVIWAIAAPLAAARFFRWE